MWYNWGEPERAPHKRYSCARIIYYVLWYVGHAKVYIQHGSMDINAKYSIAHSHAGLQAVYTCGPLLQLYTRGFSTSMVQVRVQVAMKAERSKGNKIET